MVGTNATMFAIRMVRSKLRKREDTRNNVNHRQDHVILHSAQNINNNNNTNHQCHHNNINGNTVTTTTTPPAVANGGTTIPTVSSTIIYPPPPPPPFLSTQSSDQTPANAPRQFIWQLPAPHTYALYNNDKETLVQLPTEQPGYCQGWRKNLKGRWRRLIKKKPSDQQYGIPPELREQLKTIYVY